MAKVLSLPNRSQIDGFRGTIDFYSWFGIPCVRRWPRWKLPTRSPAVQSAGQAFSYVNQMAKELPSDVVESWQFLATKSGLTWKDWLVRAYMGGTLTPPGMPPI